MPKPEVQSDGTEGNTLLWQHKEEQEPSDDDLGLDQDHRSHLLI